MSAINKNSVISTVGAKFASFNHDTSSNRADAAVLRRNGLKPVVDSPDTWSIIYRDVDWGSDVFPVVRERLDLAFLCALVIYSTQRRANESTHSGAAPTIGSILAKIQRGRPNPASVDRKVSALLSGSSVLSISRDLLALLNMHGGVTIDYASLVWDLYRLQTPYARTVLLAWGKDYYRSTNSPTNQEKKS